MNHMMLEHRLSQPLRQPNNSSTNLTKVLDSPTKSNKAYVDGISDILKGDAVNGLWLVLEQKKKKGKGALFWVSY